MTSDHKSENSLDFGQLEYQEIVGLIQLMIDTNSLDEDQRNGFYIRSADARMEALSIFEKLTRSDTSLLIEYLLRSGYID